MIKKALNIYEKFMSYKGGLNKSIGNSHSFIFFKYNSFIYR